MMKTPRHAASALAAAGMVTVLCVAPTNSDARLIKLDVEKREPLVGGAAYGSAGPYERLMGTAPFEVDALLLGMVVLALVAIACRRSRDSRRQSAEGGRT